ncbi:MAG TPA: peptidylprolyl isomerase [Patescibacteria group bacterium]|nr:peptidylprolyl isomerase [Patescibacteria group bacterium]
MEPTFSSPAQPEFPQTPVTPPASSAVAKKNLRFFVLGVLVFLGLAILTSLGVGVYRVYAKAATDPFTTQVARVLRLPAMKVNGKRVSYSEYVSDMKAIRVMREYDRQTGGAGAALTDEQMSDQVLWRLANNVLVEEAAKEFNLKIEDTEVDALKNEIYTQLQQAENGGIANVEEAKKKADEELMKRYGWNMDDYSKKVMRPYLLQQKLGEKLQGDQQAREAVRTKAEEVLKKLKAGADFAATAKQYGEDGSAENGGDLDFFARGTMVPQFEEAAFSLKKGQLKQELVETQYGYHIIKVDDRRTVKTKDSTGKTVNTEEVRARHILFRFPSLEEYLDEKARTAKVDLHIKVHNPFKIEASQSTTTPQ